MKYSLKNVVRGAKLTGLALVASVGLTACEPSSTGSTVDDPTGKDVWRVYEDRGYVHIEDVDENDANYVIGDGINDDVSRIDLPAEGIYNEQEVQAWIDTNMPIDDPDPEPTPKPDPKPDPINYITVYWCEGLNPRSANIPESQYNPSIHSLNPVGCAD